MAGIRTRLGRQRARRRDAERKIERFRRRIATRLVLLARRPRLAAYLARRFNLEFTSGWRSARHNAAIGGAPGSWHTRGTRRKPGAIDLAGTPRNERAALRWARRNVPELTEAFIHDAGSGRHLHLAGSGVMHWRWPRRGKLRRWLAGLRRQRRRRRDAQGRIRRLRRRLERG